MQRSRRSPTRVAREREAHFKSSAQQDDDDLVFANPATGGPLDRSKVRKRFQAASRRAGVRVAMGVSRGAVVERGRNGSACAGPLRSP